MSMDDLVPLSEALRLEKSKFNKIVKEFMPYTQYCGSMMIPDKMADWCTYLQCDSGVCKNKLAQETMNKVTPSLVTSSYCIGNSSRDPILDYNTSCFDNFFCTPNWASKDYHYILGVFGISLAVFSLIFSIIYLTGFHKEFGRKNTRALLLSAQTICDIFFIVLTVIGSLSIYTYYTDLVDQLKLYSSFHIYLVLYILPFGSLFESMSIWIWILLIFDRFNYLSHGTHSENLLTKKVCSMLLGAIFISLVAFSSLKPFLYEMEKISNNANNYRLVYSTIGKTENYQNLLQFWLKMPMESLLPLSTVGIFIVMVVHKLIFGMSLNSKRHSSYIEFQEHRLTKSILFISSILLVAKVPKMALHILKYEIGIHIDAEVKFYLFCEFADQMYYFIKTCFLYQYMCPVFSQNLQNLFCFDKKFGTYDFSKEISYRVECDDDEKDFLFESNCKELMYKAAKIDKETIV